MNEVPRAAARPGDERVRKHGLQVVLRFLAAIRIARSYQVDNQVFLGQATALIEALGPIFVEVPEAVLVSLDGDLYMNGVRLPVSVTNLRFHQQLMEEFTRRRIAGVRIIDGIGEEELSRFFGLFLQPDTYNGPGLLEACLAEQTGHILPAVSASTEAGDGGDAFVPPEPGTWTEAESTGGGFGGDAGEGGGGSGDEAASGAGPGAGPGVRPVARKSYSLAMVGARSVLTTTALQEGLEMRHAKRVVQPLIDGAFADEPVVVGLSSLSHHDEYTYAHSVNVCIVAVTMGHTLGLDRRALADLGVAALLHDVGKAAMYDRVNRPLEELEGDERRLAESHALEGAKLIARSPALNGTTLRSMRVALEHHAARGVGQRGDAAGYPRLPADWRTSGLSAIVSCADCYVSLQMHRSARGRSVTPYQALGMVLGPLSDRFDPAVLWALVRSVGLYPPGQIVELSDGRIAVVLAPNKEDPSRPHVRVIMDECGVPFSAIEAKELKPIPPELSVARALPADEYPEIPMAA